MKISDIELEKFQLPGCHYCTPYEDHKNICKACLLLLPIYYLQLL